MRSSVLSNLKGVRTGFLRTDAGRRVGLAIALALLMTLGVALATQMSSEAQGPDIATPVPRAKCQPGDKPDTQLQGQIPIADRASGRAAEGYFCNLRVIGTHEGRAFASFDSYENCLYMSDQTWAQSAVHSGKLGTGAGPGLRVLDMTKSEHPVQTDVLTSPIAKAPDESLAVNARRGLLVMNSTGDTEIDVYDLKVDCKRPRLVGTFDMAPATGHAGWFSPDGMTYWMTSSIIPKAENIFPIDLTDPAKPKLQARWETKSGTFGHNGWTSDDSKTAYACQAAATNGADNKILAFRAPETGKPGGSTGQHLISSFHLEGMTCQDAKAVSYNGKPYLIANSEYALTRGPLWKGPSKCGVSGGVANFGTPQIYDISDIKQPKTVRHLMLEVDDPKNCQQTAIDGDMTTDSQTPGEVYDTHFCRPDRLRNPTILACARFYSGLQVYDIRDPRRPKELAYYRPGALGQSALQNPSWGANPASLEDCFAPPIVRAEKGEIWFGCYFSGLRVVKFPKSVYPFEQSLTCEDDYYFDQYNPGVCSASAKGCVRSMRGIRGTRVGPAVLNRARKRQRSLIGARLKSRRGGIDRYCIAGGASLRIGYPTRRLNRGFGRSVRNRIRSRAQLALTTSKRVSVKRLRVGSEVRTMQRRLRGERRYRVGRNVWYVARGKRARVVFRTNGGRVREIGLINKRLASTSRSTRRLLRAWQL